jgi:predicted DNA binding CopG/RHH family protein
MLRKRILPRMSEAAMTAVKNPAERNGLVLSGVNR